MRSGAGNDSNRCFGEQCMWCGRVLRYTRARMISNRSKIKIKIESRMISNRTQTDSIWCQLGEIARYSWIFHIRTNQSLLVLAQVTRYSHRANMAKKKYTWQSSFGSVWWWPRRLSPTEIMGETTVIWWKNEGMRTWWGRMNTAPPAPRANGFFLPVIPSLWTEIRVDPHPPHVWSNT